MSKPSSALNVMHGENKISSGSGGSNQFLNQRIVVVISLFVGAALSCLLLYHTAYPFEFLPSYYSYDVNSALVKNKAMNASTNTSTSARMNTSTNTTNSNSTSSGSTLEKILENAAMEGKTVIITTLNQAWAEPHSIFDIFLESFRTGNGISRYLNHLVVVSLDAKAHARCVSIHPHCYALNTSGLDFSGTEKYFMTSDYLQMMWIRIRLLSKVLEMGYNFLFTDADIVWLQDPFQHFYPDADFQIACDNYLGNSSDLNNMPNGGFNFARSNPRTIEFYKYWYNSRTKHPGLHDQDVLNKIKFDPYLGQIGVKIRFLDTVYYAGFCELSKDFNVVCTMHANCCFGLESKIQDLNLVLQDWKNFMQLPPDDKALKNTKWSVPKNCSLSAFHPPPAVPRNVQPGNQQ